MRIIHFTGIRLGAAFPEWPEHGERIRRSLKEALIQLFERAREVGADALVSAGDLFDSNLIPLETVRSISDLCEAYPETALIVTPGTRDPWGDYSVYHHLLTDTPKNLVVVPAGRSEPVKARPGLWIYALAPDTGRKEMPPFSSLARGDGEGVHVAVVHGDLGRPKPGPEPGMVVVSAEIGKNPFDYVAFADGGPSEPVGRPEQPAAYAGGLAVFASDPRGAGVAWDVKFGGGTPKLEAVTIKGVRHREVSIDVTSHPDAASVATAIAAAGDEKTLLSVVLTGGRPADRPLIDRVLRRQCERDLLGLKIIDATELLPPQTLSTQNPALAVLWEGYRTASGDEQRTWADALKLFTAGITDPASWQEAPWAR